MTSVCEIGSLSEEASEENKEYGEKAIEPEAANDQDDEEEYEEAPASLEDGGQPTIDELEEIHLGTTEDPRPTFVAKALPEEEKMAIKQLLQEFRDVFAWNYTEMPGRNALS